MKPWLLEVSHPSLSLYSSRNKVFFREEGREVYRWTSFPVILPITIFATAF